MSGSVKNKINVVHEKLARVELDHKVANLNIMEIVLTRDVLHPKRTMGKMYIDNVFECFTLEDTVREKGVKIKGETAIPYGRHKVVANYSPRFKKRMPEIIVPMFTGIRIHNGSHEGHTEGCILCGRERTSERLLRGCGHEVNQKILDAIDAGRPVFITIR
jgi:hypothetical protein